MMQATDYGSCVAAKVPEVERDMCLKEFLALKNCMQNVVLTTITDKGYVLGCDMIRRTYSRCLFLCLRYLIIVQFFFLLINSSEERYKLVIFHQFVAGLY